MALQLRAQAESRNYKVRQAGGLSGHALLETPSPGESRYLTPIRHPRLHIQSSVPRVGGVQKRLLVLYLIHMHTVPSLRLRVLENAN